MQLGIIGVGHLAGSLLQGLARAGVAMEDISLSPRGRGAELAKRFGAYLAKDNAEVVTRSTLVLLTVRPAQAADVVAGLPWRAGQTLLSACAGVSRSSLDAHPAQVVRIMPITAAEHRASPTLVYPAVLAVQPFLDAIGTTIALQTEHQFEAGTVNAAIYGWAQALIKLGADWGTAQGLDPANSRALSAQTFMAAGLMQADHSQSMDATLQSLLTPGGITEAGLASLEQADVMTAWEEACALVLRRLQG